MEFLIQCLAICAVCLYIAKNQKNWFSFVQSHPHVEYRRTENLDAWRWSDPPEGVLLRKEDSSGCSRLKLPDIRINFNEGGTFVGCCLILFAIGLWCYFLFIILSSGKFNVDMFSAIGAVSVAPLFIAFIGYCAFYLDSRAVAIELERDRVIIVIRYGVILFRRFTYRRNRIRSFSGKIQSSWTMERDQEVPRYHLSVKRGFFSKTFVTDCDPSQGNWIVAGLENWRMLDAL